MNFRPDLAEKVRAGEKTVTRRLASDNPRSPWYIGCCGYAAGQSVTVCPGRGKHALGRVVVRGATLERLGRLSDEDARAEGFSDHQMFEEAWATINGGMDTNALVWRVELEAGADTHG